MPCIESACVEWLDKDLMPQVHLEALKVGFRAPNMVKVPMPCQPKEPPPAHLMRAAKRGHERGSSDSGMAPLGKARGSVAMSNGSCDTHESEAPKNR